MFNTRVNTDNKSVTNLNFSLEIDSNKSSSNKEISSKTNFDIDHNNTKQSKKIDKVTIDRLNRNNLREKSQKSCTYQFNCKPTINKSTFKSKKDIGDHIINNLQRYQTIDYFRQPEQAKVEADRLIKYKARVTPSVIDKLSQNLNKPNIPDTFS